MKNIPLYTYPASHAEKEGELDLYRESFRANVACKEAIQESIHNHYANNTLDSTACVNEVVRQFGIERVFYVLANTVQHKLWDGRISPSNKEWAKTIIIHPDGGYGGNRLCRFVVDGCNPGLTNLFLTSARKMHGKESA